MCIRDRYSSGAETKLGEDLARMDKITKEVSPRYPAEELKAVSYTHLRAHETPEQLVCRLLLEKKNQNFNFYSLYF